MEESSDPRALAALLGELDLARAVLMPCSDRWANAVAGLDSVLAERFPASVSAGRAVEILTDKEQLRSALDRLGVPMPRTIPVSTPEDMDVVSDVDIPHFFLKPRDSQSFSEKFRRKAFSLRDRDEAVARLREMQAAGFEAVLQEYVPGPMTSHHFIDGFKDRFGVTRALFARQRLLMYPTDFGNSTLMVSEPLSDVGPAALSLEKLLSDLRYRGIFSAEFKQDERDGEFRLLEVNVRPWWFIEFAALAGVDVCTLAYRDALSMPVETVNPYVPGDRHMMFVQHIRALARLRSDRKLTFRSWLNSSRGARDAVFRWSDPLPGLAMAIAYVGKSLKTKEGNR